MVHSLNTPGPTLVVVVTTITTNTAHDEHTTLYLNFSRFTLNCFADLLGLFRFALALFFFSFSSKTLTSEFKANFGMEDSPLPGAAPTTSVKYTKGAVGEGPEVA